MRKTIALTLVFFLGLSTTSIALAKKYGSLKVFSEVKNVKIYVDRKLKGASPIYIKNIPIGEHYIKATKQGKKVFSKLIKVKRNAVTTVLIKDDENSTFTTRSNVREKKGGGYVYIGTTNSNFYSNSNIDIGYRPTGGFAFYGKTSKYSSFELGMSIALGEGSFDNALGGKTYVKVTPIYINALYDTSETSQFGIGINSSMWSIRTATTNYSTSGSLGWQMFVRGKSDNAICDLGYIVHRGTSLGMDISSSGFYINLGFIIS